MMLRTPALALTLTLLGATPAAASGILTPKGSPDQPIQILDHRVEVVINNGYARTEVAQTFFNPNERDLEAVYSFPVPKSASLSEMSILAGETVLDGEVLRDDEARRIYEEERDSGDDAGLAEKNAYQTYEFFVARVPAQDETSFRFVYYQALEIDTGIGRYLYPLEEGGTDDLALAFWDTEREVRRHFSFHLELKSAWPIEKLRMPGFEAAAQIECFDPGHWEVTLDAPGGVSLDRDLLVYYRLQDDLPGRIELVPFRDDPDGSGTFMLVVTPGIDLAPLSEGADYVFVLDTSGSMAGKIHTLVDGVERALGELNPLDRFRIITFNEDAYDLLGGLEPATPERVEKALRKVARIEANGGTNLYAPLKKALRGLDEERATSLVLVTDAVANRGVIEPKRFHELLKSTDVRVFGFLLGNSGNWPLMRTICDASGGFYAGISNADDVVGKLLQAKAKITHECLHDAELTVEGVRVHDMTHIASKVYRGQQLVLFGRYAGPGPAEVRLKARITGEDRVYRTTTVLPAIDDENPEIERLWAMDRIEEIQRRIDRGDLHGNEGKNAIADLGVAYQLVTDHTSMLVLENEEFEKRDIERHNQKRVAREREAQARRVGHSARGYRVDSQQPAFQHNAPSMNGSGGGAIDPFALGLALLAGALWWPLRRPRGRERS